MTVDISILPDNAHYIAGAFVRSRGEQAIAVYDPATGEEIKQIAAAAKADVDDAVAAARKCFDSRAWRKIAAADRAAALWKFADNIIAHMDEFVELEVRDNGMTKAMAMGTVMSCANTLRYYAGMVQKIHGRTSDLSTPDREVMAYTSLEPVGVVSAITPWNAPLAVLVNKIAPAIAAGCSIVAKPAEQTPLSSIRLGQFLSEWQLFPDGLINIINGYGHVAGAALADHPDVDKITFTGSTEVGKRLVQAAAGNLKRVTLELGGKSPVFIFDDADMSSAIPAAAGAIFANSGQVCYAGSRLYIQNGVYDQVVEGVAKIANAMKLGSGFEEKTQLGPLVSQEQMNRVLNYIDHGVNDGADLVFGGGRVGERGYFVKPAVFANRDRKKMRITEDEIFGPVVTAMPFDGLDELESLANDTSYGLGSGVFTSCNSKAHRAAKMIRAGVVWINCYHILDKAIPFGGFKQSGWGREMGFDGIAPFLETKAVYNSL